jgi:peptide/nickel transport system permease protein
MSVKPLRFITVPYDAGTVILSVLAICRAFGTKYHRVHLLIKSEWTIRVESAASARRVIGNQATRKKHMRAYLLRRALLILPTFIGISFITFLVVQLAPGSPVYMQLRQGNTALSSDRASQAIIEQTTKLYGLDKPIWKRYAIWIGKLAVFDFGNSYKDQRPVRDKIFETIPVTLQIELIVVLLVYMISIPLGVFSATHQHSFGDYALTALLFILYSLPSFWVAMLAIVFLGGGQFLNWFPIVGLSSSGAENLAWGPWLLDRAWHLVLPVACLTYGGLAGMSRYARAGMIEVIRQDYIRTARAYGFSEKTVVFKYAMRNSLIPIVTLLATLLPDLIAGSFIIESIFSIPGMGKLGFEALLSRDYPLVMGILSMSAFLTLVGLILSDVMYTFVDPRIKFE